MQPLVNQKEGGGEEGGKYRILGAEMPFLETAGVAITTSCIRGQQRHLP